jgi:hypothetical protein
MPVVVDQYLRFRVATSQDANAEIGERKDAKSVSDYSLPIVHVWYDHQPGG